MNIGMMNSTSVWDVGKLSPAQNMKNLASGEKRSVEDSFGDVLTRALGKVNDLELKSDEMIQKMIVEPDKVNIHEVTALMSQAEMALSMTKAVTDRVVTAYREIVNLR